MVNLPPPVDSLERCCAQGLNREPFWIILMDKLEMGNLAKYDHANPKRQINQYCNSTGMYCLCRDPIQDFLNVRYSQRTSVPYVVDELRLVLGCL